VPLHQLTENPINFQVYNSLLSEYAVMGFEAGYSMASPHTLTIWEAQFGDFVNGAQIVIDQFLASGTSKWQRLCGLVLLLPHGYSGQGPEHSRARPERFFELCAANNMYVLNCTTPANFFHALRRQVRMDTRRPMVVFTPKNLLRHPECISPKADFLNGTTFRELYDDDNVKAADVTRVVLTSGQLYYDLLENQRTHNVKNVAIVRLEQLYPLPMDQIDGLLAKKYKKAKEVIWAQEEPENMGAWSFILRKLRHISSLEVVSRKESGSPATGSKRQHLTQQAYIVRKSLNLNPEAEVKV
jgi:2-oxoglutarate dehydrogenase E1 component